MERSEVEKRFDYLILHKRVIFCVLLIVLLMHGVVLGNFVQAVKSFFVSLGFFFGSWACGFLVLITVRILFPKITTRRFFRVLSSIAILIIAFFGYLDCRDSSYLASRSSHCFGCLFAILSICELYYIEKSDEDSQTNTEAETDSDDDDAEYKESDMVYTNAQSLAIAKKIIEQSSVPAVKIKTKTLSEEVPFEQRVCSSRFGGLPYWESGESYPTSEDGEPLYLLAQINFAEVPNVPDFPASGLLQIFIASGEDFGCSVNDEQTNWRVIFRKDFDAARAMSEESLRACGVKPCSDLVESEFPLEREFELSFEPLQSPVNQSCYEFDDAYPKAVKTLKLRYYDKANYTSVFTNEANDVLWGDKTPYHQIGGYPNFTEDMDRPDGYVLLFQMDCDNGIMWGENKGLAHFLIPREDLLNLDFSNVFYTWDNVYL